MTSATAFIKGSLIGILLFRIFAAQAQTSCGTTARGCLTAKTGYRVHKIDSATGKCSQRCRLSNVPPSGWKCGACPKPTPTAPVKPPSPIASPIKTPVQAPSTPVKPPIPLPAPVSPIAPVKAPVPIIVPVTPNPPVKAPTVPVAPPTQPTGPVTAPRSPIAPVPAPIQPVAPTPTTAVTPVGQYITSGYSEKIQIPKPIAPVLTSTQTNCPHLAAGLFDWHSAGTWTSGSVPTSGDVTLPANRNVVITRTVAETLDVITIPSTSSLIIGENNAGIELKARGLAVQGQLISGSETCRIQKPITITLNGPRPANPVQNRPVETYKGISVTGTISLHGKRYFRTWTRLAKTVNIGENVILLQDPVNWEVGQKIVVVTTALKDSREWHQNEEHTITAVSSPSSIPGVGSSITVANLIKHKHIANSGYQAEVGLLTRMIKIQGSATDSEPTDLDPLNCVLPNGSNRYGDVRAPCGFKEITGFGGHVMVHQSGRGYVQGVEFYRMGQTNVLGRYPMHFHLLGNCPECYVRDSSFHRSYYRCISIHGTNNATISENVAFDVTGYCYYLEDGVEENNTLSFNLAAFIHAIGPEPPGEGDGQGLNSYYEGPSLTLPADVTASGFYITNVHNNIIGNAASGGWAGFAFPLLRTALQTFRTRLFRPSSVTSLTIDGNSAHSTGWWWGHGSAFYFGGELFYNSNNVLEYNPGRGGSRSPCKVDACTTDCDWGCPAGERAFLRITNTKAFLAAGIGLNSWTGTMEVVGYEAHDTGLSIESLAEAFWIDKALVVCRTGENLVKPTIPQFWQRMRGDGFFWYDTGQEHIITDSVFRNCGYRSDKYNQYDQSTNRGCGDSDSNGCTDRSTVFGFLTHSDQFTPELMQGTRAITFDNCGRRFTLNNWLNNPNTVSGRNQNWIDADGSASGLGVPTMMVSGVANVSTWWHVDSNVRYDPQGPLRFIPIQPQTGAPNRGLAHIGISWDIPVHQQVGYSTCGNGNQAPCPSLGYIRHAGKKFSGTKTGTPVTARGEIVGPVGGYGWILELNGGAPRDMNFTDVEVLPETPLIISIAYPVGTTFSITAHAAPWCWQSTDFTCSQSYTQVGSIQQVRTGPGNQYYVDGNGVLTFRIAQHPQYYVGRPNWFIPSRTDRDIYDNRVFAVERFERSGVYLPHASYGPYLRLKATCGGTGPYCSGTPVTYDPNVCPSGYDQVSYDYCCRTSNPADCVYP